VDIPHFVQYNLGWLTGAPVRYEVVVVSGTAVKSSDLSEQAVTPSSSTAKMINRFFIAEI